jgi:hypothetical protein
MQDGLPLAQLRRPEAKSPSPSEWWTDDGPKSRAYYRGVNVSFQGVSRPTHPQGRSWVAGGGISPFTLRAFCCRRKRAVEISRRYQDPKKVEPYSLHLCAICRSAFVGAISYL